MNIPIAKLLRLKRVQGVKNNNHFNDEDESSVTLYLFYDWDQTNWKKHVINPPL